VTEPTPEELAEYERLAEISIAVQRAYQRGFEDGRRAERRPVNDDNGSGDWMGGPIG
jgi:hypothetical protein